MASDTDTQQLTFGGRYRTVELLGRGGMGEVYRVDDLKGSEPRALKRLAVPQGPGRERAEALFASEYQVLSDLSHPRMVRVHDYGIEDGTPYYVMDLIAGSDLQARAPMPWREVCSVLHDLCTSLSLLHARGLVHRDVSPRNLCIGGDGRAMLIDFGAMAPFGPCYDAVGTPAFVAPEVLHGQRIDGRTDLYSVGAVGYFLLTGSNAYPARDWRQLRDLWRSRPAPLGAVQEDIPSALDQLITSLLALDMTARAKSAAEVLDRLETVAQLPPNDLEYAHSFLVSPRLIGRDAARMSFRKRMVRAMRGRGSSILIQGAPGAGRSRLLESHVLEGKLVGALVMHGSALAWGGDDFATVMALLRQFKESAPEFFADTVEPHLSILGHLSSELQPADEDPYELVEFPDDDTRRAAIRRTLVRWIGSLRQYMCVLIAVDDIDHCDAESAATILELASLGAHGRVVVAATASHASAIEPGTPAHQMAGVGACCALHALSANQTEQLLESIFGAVPGLEQVSAWVFALSEGYPGMSMRLAQHLVDTGAARFEAGRWILPGDLAEMDLPQKLEEALELGLRSVSPQALCVAQMVAVTVPEFPLEQRHYRKLDAIMDGGVFASLEELKRAALLVASGGQLSFRHGLLRRAALGLASDATRLQLHHRLSEVYDHCDDATAVVAHHLRLAGERDQAYQRLGLAPAVPAEEDSDEEPAMRFYRSRAGIDLIRFGLEYAIEHGRSEKTLFRWRSVLLGQAFLYPELSAHGPQVLSVLRRDTGMSIRSELDPGLKGMPLIQAMLQRAQQAYDELAPRERGLSPTQALYELATTVLTLCGTYTRTWDTSQFQELVELVAPWRELSPTMAFVHDTTLLCHRSCVRGEDVRALRSHLMHLTADDVPGMDEETRKHAHLILAFYLGLDEAETGLEDAMEVARILDAEPSYRSLAAEVRLLFHLTQGDAQRAREARAERDLLALGEAHGSQLAVGPIWEGLLHYQVGDLIALRQLRPHFARQAHKYPGWVPWQRLFEGLYQMLHRDYSRADGIFTEALLEIAPLQHRAWHHMAIYQIESALGMGDAELAAKRAAELEALLEGEAVHVMQPAVLVSHSALALAHTGDPAQAIERIEHCLDEQRELRQSGIHASLLYETRARIALLLDDGPSFETAARRVAAQYRPGHHPGLLSRYERLMDDAAAAKYEVSEELSEAAVAGDSDDFVTDPTFATTLQTLLGGCEGAEDRARTVLQLLIERTGADAGYLYACRDGNQLELIARQAAQLPTAKTRLLVDEHFHGATDDGEIPQGPLPSATPGEGDFEPHLLWSRREGEVMITGVAALRITQGGHRVPFELLAALSDALLAAGDVQAARLP